MANEKGTKTSEAVRIRNLCYLGEYTEKKVVEEEKAVSDDAGHIHPNAAGGSGESFYNIFPQTRKMNTGLWGWSDKVIRDIHTACSGVKDVSVKFRLLYDDYANKRASRPYAAVVEVTAYLIDSTSLSRVCVLPNPLNEMMPDLIDPDTNENYGGYQKYTATDDQTLKKVRKERKELEKTGTTTVTYNWKKSCYAQMLIWQKEEFQGNKERCPGVKWQITV